MDRNCQIMLLCWTLLLTASMVQIVSGKPKASGDVPGQAYGLDKQKCGDLLSLIESCPDDHVLIKPHTGIDGTMASESTESIGLQCVLKDINDCDPNPCQNGGSCQDGENSYTCTCAAGFTGNDCETDINDCDPNPCQNGGSCQDGENSYTCACVAGFTDNDCETDINDCDPNPCPNWGSCQDGENSYTCACVAGFTGNDCETDINDCDPNPCQNGGSCQDGENSYTCACVAGFTGNDCETDINDCDPDPCQNGGSCQDGENSYTCACVAGYTGDNCETETSSPYTTVNEYVCGRDMPSVTRCVCQPADMLKSGTFERITSCDPPPCLNGGVCDIDREEPCSCHQGFYGRRCEFADGMCISLWDGPSANEGFVYYTYRNYFWVLLDNTGSDDDASVICHMLGYQRTGAKMLADEPYHPNPIYTNYVLHDVYCDGTENDIRDCLGSHTTGPLESAMKVKCQP